MTLIYIHGFASCGNGSKSYKLREMYPNLNIFSPTLNHRPELAIHELDNTINKCIGDKILIGTSLGGFYATYFSTLKRVPSIIINPMTNPSVMERYVGVLNDVSGNEFEFRNEDCKFLHDLKREIVSCEKHYFYFNVVLGGKDELLTYETLDELIPCKRTFTIFPNETHRFSNIHLIKPLIDFYINDGLDNH